MKELKFTNDAWEQYEYWQSQDKKILKRINLLLKDIKRDFFNGIGDPEPLKYDLVGKWSRRIDDVNRLVYEIINDGDIRVLQCKGHYND
jgi:toxin YoeB